MAQYDFKVTQKYIDKIYSLSKKIPNLEIIPGTLSSIEYYGLLDRSDIVVLPYRDNVYRTADSGVFIETIIAGKVAVVSSGTTMASYLSEYSLGDLIFKRENVRDLVDVIKNTVYNYKYYQAKVKKMQEEYRKIYAFNNLVNSLLEI